jgi:hypothetical protein
MAAAWLLLLVTAACGNASTPPETQPARSGTAISPPATSEAPEPARVLRFEAPDLARGVIRGADYAGKDVALWFWAPW